MNKKTQMIIGIAAIAGVAYFLLNNKKKDKVFANYANLRGPGKGTIQTTFGEGGLVGPVRPAQPCSSGQCVDGRCTVLSYGPQGAVIGSTTHMCAGSGEDIQVGQMINTY
jgi:hypothetical protein